MRALDKMVQDTQYQCRYLLDREGIIDYLFGAIRKAIKAEALIVSGVSGTGYDQRCVLSGYPPGFVMNFMNKEHAKLAFYSAHIKEALAHGYHTRAYNDCEKNYPEDYKERYEPYGLKCGLQTSFADADGNIIGVFGCLKKAEAIAL